jgi:CubicO group peptidase (beta-lactamase class C family)
MTKTEDFIHGETDARFAAVAMAFRDNFAAGGDLGAACSVYWRGEPVVDLWGGLTDSESRRVWQEDTLVPVFSTSKGAVAICVNLLAERGALDLGAPVARYWPEFAEAGKGDIAVSTVLAHRAGLPVVDADLTREEVFAWRPVIASIEKQRPLWEPGTAHGYHARTFGWILGEVVRRVTGRSLGTYFADEIARPLGLHFYIGLPESLEPLVATLYPPPPPTDPAEIEIRERFMGAGTLLGRVLDGPGDLAYGPVWNSRALHAAEIPSSNGIGDARSLARMYAATIGEIDGVRLLRPETVESARRVASDGPDRVIHLDTRFGLGFMLPPTLALDCPPSCFGHPGAGGSLAFADPQANLAFGYVTNQMRLGMTGDERTRNLIRATYAALGDGT